MAMTAIHVNELLFYMHGYKNVDIGTQKQEVRMHNQ